MFLLKKLEKVLYPISIKVQTISQLYLYMYIYMCIYIDDVIYTFICTLYSQPRIRRYSWDGAKHIDLGEYRLVRKSRKYRHTV